jgi:fused signal recognition particle receptor
MVSFVAGRELMFHRFKKVEEGTQKTRATWFSRVSALFDRRSIDDSLWDELEELLIGADLGVGMAEEIIQGLRAKVNREGIRDADGVRGALRGELVNILQEGVISTPPGDGARPQVYLMVGVNGVGKTTTIAKLGRYLQEHGQRVLFAAADTFRAAAIDQLKIWGQRVGVEVVAHQPGSDPGAVVFDAVQAAISRGVDVVIVDTAGRLHTKFNLMEEMKKIERVVSKFEPALSREVLLVLDATTGQNSISQAKSFAQAVGVTGLIIAKLDGTAKGGAIFPIVRELGLPVRFLGTGEKVEDLVEFDPTAFVGALFA